MTEQCKHEWDFSDGEFPFACVECGVELPLLDVLSRLNEYDKLKKATERLNAEVAQVGSQYLIQHALTMECPSADNEAKVMRLLKRIVSHMQAYADILEGK